MQTRKTFGEILIGNQRFFRLGIRLTPYNCAYLASFIFLLNKSIVFRITRLLITNNRLALPTAIGSDYV